MTTNARMGRRGQTLVLFTLFLPVLLIAAGLVIDGGYAWAQRRSAQNAADLASLAGARVVALSLKGDPAGTDQNVKAAIIRIVADGGGVPIDWTSTDPAKRPSYTKFDGSPEGALVGGGTIPADAMGVRVPAGKSWSPFFLGALAFIPGGVVPSKLNAGAQAIARAGYLANPPAGDVFPMALDSQNFDPSKPGHLTICPTGSAPVSQGGTCPDATLDDSNHKSGQLGPGNFGWVTFGQANGCANFGLGMFTAANDPSPSWPGGCPNGNPSGFLQDEINGNSHGCCSAPTGAAWQPGKGPDMIGGGPGHNGQGGDNCTVPITSKATYFLPVYDAVGGQGNSYWYHIVGFVGFQITACNGGKNATGVWREPVFPGPVQSTPTPGGFSLLGIQLVQ